MLERPAPPPDRRSRPRRPILVALAAVLVVAVVVAAVVVLTQGDEPAGPSATADRFAAAWTAGRDRAASQETDRPAAAAAALLANRKGLDGATVSAKVGPLDEHGTTAAGRLRVTWRVPNVGAWSYTSPVVLHRTNGDWRVAWKPTVVSPALTERGSRLGTTAERGTRAPIIDRNGNELVSERAVVRIGVVHSKVKDVAATAAQLHDALGIDAKAFAKQVEGAGPVQFVEALTVRAADYRALKPRLKGIEGLLVVDDEAPLAPTRSFGRAVLGGVGPITPEQLKKLGGQYAVGDVVGQWGLQSQFERQLAGTPTRRVVVRVDGVPAKTLLTKRGVRPKPLKTTLDGQVQAAAEQALGDGKAASALVAVQPSTGDVVAVSNRPVDSTYDRALLGQYAPGSTFKVVTTAALLRAGFDASSSVACPPSIVVDGKTFTNFEGEAAGSVPFSEDFAQSCNTAFVSLADKLKPDALTDTAKDFGLGQPVRLPVPVSPSDVPAGRTAVEQAAAMIGQERIVATPLAMAGVAATVADGRWRAPRILQSQPRAAAGPKLDDRELSELRDLMRGVVTSGTGNAVASVPGGPVAGKTGTAEYGSGDPPPTHAWFIAYRGDLAVAVLVEDGSSGGVVAAPIAARFFSALSGEGAG